MHCKRRQPKKKTRAKTRNKICDYSMIFLKSILCLHKSNRFRNIDCIQNGAKIIRFKLAYSEHLKRLLLMLRDGTWIPLESKCVHVSMRRQLNEMIEILNTDSDTHRANGMNEVGREMVIITVSIRSVIFSIRKFIYRNQSQNLLANFKIVLFDAIVCACSMLISIWSCRHCRRCHFIRSPLNSI